MMISSGVSSCNSLKSLSVRNCPEFGNYSLALLGQLCHQFQKVVLNGLHRIKDNGFTSLIQNSEAGLTKVDLSCCLSLTDKNCKILRELDVSKSAITDISIAALACAEQLKIRSNVMESAVPQFVIWKQNLTSVISLFKIQVCNSRINNQSVMSSSQVNSSSCAGFYRRMVEAIWAQILLSLPSKANLDHYTDQDVHYKRLYYSSWLGGDDMSPSSSFKPQQL
nr:hypothetical protein [Tanacetum cinerariifolium]